MRYSRVFARGVRALLSVIALLFATPLSADHLMITRYFSGAWAQPDHESQGIMLHIAEQVDGSRIGVAHWFTFGPDLESAWYVALGPVDGHGLHMRLFAASGIGFLEPDVEGDALVEEIGTLILSFHNCNQGTAAYETPEEALGSGEFRIRRLTSLFRSRCSGGISDDTPSDKRPEKLSVRLQPARDDISGEGKSMFWQRADRSDFKVEVEGMPDGIYDLLVCEVDVGNLEVIAGEGGLEYRSPAIGSKPLLDFDPVNCRIDVSDGAGLALTSGDAVLLEWHGHEGHDSGSKGPDSRVWIEADLTSTGVIEGAEGEAEFEATGAKMEFSVEISHVPAGVYSLSVGGSEEADFEVFEDGGVFRGKVKFSNPPKAETLLLDFDPRSEIVEVLQGDVVILESLFPDE